MDEITVTIRLKIVLDVDTVEPRVQPAVERVSSVLPDKSNDEPKAEVKFGSGPILVGQINTIHALSQSLKMRVPDDLEDWQYDEANEYVKKLNGKGPGTGKEATVPMSVARRRQATDEFADVS